MCIICVMSVISWIGVHYVVEFGCKKIESWLFLSMWNLLV
jgi:hypothetical protein